MSKASREYWGEFVHMTTFAFIITLLFIGWITSFKLIAAHATFLPKGLSDLLQSV